MSAFDKLLSKGKDFLDQNTIRNGSISAEEVLAIVRDEFPEYKSKDLGTLGSMRIEMKKGFTRIWVMRGRGQDRIYVRRGPEGCFADLFTLGFAYILNEIGQRDRPRVFKALKERIGDNEA